MLYLRAMIGKPGTFDYWYKADQCSIICIRDENDLAKLYTYLNTLTINPVSNEITLEKMVEHATY